MTVISNRYEDLGDRRFQQFAQALLSYEFPDIQSFPLGQADGGRDATVREPDGGEFQVFQVKFSEKPERIPNAETWIKGIVEDELPKIEALMTRGAKKWFLVTNVDGTGSLDAGSIDQVQSVLDGLLPLPSRVIWRSELETRLSKHIELKWQFRELLTGDDRIVELISAGLTEDRDRREAALRAAFASQYEADGSVRFKQVELQNDLFELFVDTPLARADRRFSPVGGGGEYSRHASSFVSGRRVQIAHGAAEYLLSEERMDRHRRMVIEGAPGQGKSTLAQLVCQVHRAILLEKDGDLETLPGSFRSAPTRMPFRIDLRELAIFVGGKDPWESVSGWGGIDPTTVRSLESFLALQVVRYSGGARFDVSDLFAVSSAGPMILLLDGFDEVPDTKKRAELVETINNGVSALEAVSRSLTTIVTSRPASFSNSPGFDRTKYPHFTLLSLSEELIFDYADKWCKAKQLSELEKQEIVGALKAKLHAPHLRDLARNPMQLAILMSLVSRLGQSLPDQRTKLYGDYMERFFDRESEKSSLVRDSRPQLMELHGYLAWKLHSRAEVHPEGGSLTATDLRAEIERFASSAASDVTEIEPLFQAVTERIFALVAIRQDRFEFEVQPLREFFAARHLYTTAQVSKTGSVRPGTKYDRFNGLGRNRFWLNVARFFAGSYDSGELASLTDNLEALWEDESMRESFQLRELIQALLSDRVFDLNVKARSEAIDLMLADFGVRDVFGRTRGEPGLVRLPAESGGDAIVRKCAEILSAPNTPRDRAEYTSEVLTHQLPREALDDLVRSRFDQTTGRGRTNWIRLIPTLGDEFSLEPKEVRELILGDGVSTEYPERCWLIANSLMSINFDEELAQLALDWILRGDRGGSWYHLSPLFDQEHLDYSPINRLAQSMVSGVTRSSVFRTPIPDIADSGATGELSPTASDLWNVIGELQSDLEDGLEIAAWSNLIDRLEPKYGPSPMLDELAATQVARMTGSSMTGDQISQLTERCHMKSWAGMRRLTGARQSAKWDEAFSACSTDFETLLVAVGAALWSKGVALQDHLAKIDAVMRSAGEADFARAYRIAAGAGSATRSASTGLSESQMSRVGLRTALVFRLRAPEKERARWNRQISHRKVEDELLLPVAVAVGLSEARSTKRWNHVLSQARAAYASLPEERVSSRYYLNAPEAVLRSIMKSASEYPIWMSEAAANELGFRIRLDSMEARAAKERWFVQSDAGSL